MPNSYAVEIHAYLSARITAAEAEAKAAAEAGAPLARRRCEGRLDALQALRAYFADHIDLTTQRYY